MKILTRNQIDAEKWDRAVMSSSRFRHYYLSYYLDACAPNWQAIIEGDYEFIWPLPIKLFPVKRVFQPLLVQQLGPVINEHFTDEKLNQALSLIQSKYVAFNIKFNDLIQEVAFGSVLQHLNVELDIPNEIDTLRKAYNRNAISNLKKAQKSELEIARDDHDFGFVIDTFKDSPRADIKELNAQFYKDVEFIYKAFLTRGEGQCYIAHLKGKKVAGLLVLKTHNRLLNFFTATTIEARDCGAMHALIDHVLVQNLNTKAVMDFEGSDDENLRFFYQSFGGAERVYLQSQFNKLPSPINKFIK